MRKNTGHQGSSYKSQNTGKRRGNSSKRQSYLNNDLSSQFPSPALLQEYEYAAEGTVDRIFKMAELEQLKRNQRQENVSRLHQKARQSGQVFGILTLIAVILAVIKLALSGHEEVAKVLIMSAFGAFVFFAFFSFLIEGGRKKRQRKLRYQNNPRRNTARK